MEIFIPGLTALLFIALIVFLILPRFGAPVLAALSLVLLVYAVNNHMELFNSEYRYSTWQEALKPYAPFVIVFVIFLLILGYILYLFGIGAGTSLPVSNLSAITNVINATNSSANKNNILTNTTTNIVNGVSDAVNTVKDTVMNGATNMKKNLGSLGNIGNILKTPSRSSYNNRNNSSYSIFGNNGSTRNNGNNGSSGSSRNNRLY